VKEKRGGGSTAGESRSSREKGRQASECPDMELGDDESSAGEILLTKPQRKASKLGGKERRITLLLGGKNALRPADGECKTTRGNSLSTLNAYVLEKRKGGSFFSKPTVQPLKFFPKPITRCCIKTSRGEKCISPFLRLRRKGKIRTRGGVAFGKKGSFSTKGHSIDREKTAPLRGGVWSAGVTREERGVFLPPLREKSRGLRKEGSLQCGGLLNF